jgi:outer membrane protein assembly factor BamA
VYSPSTTGAVTNLSSSANLYFQFSATHQVNQSISYSLTVGRSTDSSFYGQPYDHYFVRLQPNWGFFRKYQLTTPFWWEKGSRLYAQGGTTDYDQFGAGINIGRGITEKLTGNLGYQFVRESGGQSSLNYTVNIVSLSFTYQF